MSFPTYDEWADAVGSTFFMAAIIDDQGTTQQSALELTATTDARQGGGFTSWSLIFQGPSDEAFEQGTATLRHDQLNELAVFLVPTGISDDVATYEASFSVASNA